MKNVFKSVILTIALFMTAVSFQACSSDDDSIPGRPTITTLEGINTVIMEESKDFTFTVNMPGGYRTHSFAVANGNIIETPTVINEGDRQASLVVNFQGLQTGTAVIQLTVTDRFGQIDKESLTIEVFESN